MRIRARVFCFALVAGALVINVSTPILLGQDVASLTGIVTDQTGAVVSGASVLLVDTKTNQTYQTVTNDLGSYIVAKLLPGPGYKVTFTKQGFRASTIENIYLGVNATHTQNAQLTVGQSTETIEVNGSGSQVTLDTTDTTVSSTLDMGLVHELPLSLRDNPLGLLAYSPGVTTAPSGDDNTLGSRDATSSCGTSSNLSVRRWPISYTDHQGISFASNL